jgi:hypothetical protein
MEGMLLCPQFFPPLFTFQINPTGCPAMQVGRAQLSLRHLLLKPRWIAWEFDLMKMWGHFKLTLLLSWITQIPCKPSWGHLKLRLGLGLHWTSMDWLHTLSSVIYFLKWVWPLSSRVCQLTGLTGIKNCWCRRRPVWRFVWRHHLFVRTVDDEDILGTVHLSEWLVHLDSARITALDMVDLHWAIPLVVYDMKQSLIKCGAYCQHLQGSLVEIHFQLFHFVFKRKDSFTADIDTIHDLWSYPPSITAHLKCKLLSMFESPANQQQVV